MVLPSATHGGPSLPIERCPTCSPTLQQRCSRSPSCLDWLDENLGDAFTPMTLLMLGLLLLSLHLAGVGTTARARGWSRSRR